MSVSAPATPNAIRAKLRVEDERQERGVFIFIVAFHGGIEEP
jgi:hypothetical protein